MTDTKELIERSEARTPRYLPSGLPANYAAIHRDQMARSPLRASAGEDK